MKDSLGDLVFVCVQAVKEEIRDDYVVLVRELGTLIRFNGLETALDFLTARANGSADASPRERAAHVLLQDFLTVGGSSCAVTVSDVLSHADGESRIDALRKLDGSQYRLVARVAARQADWFKRFAESVLQTPQSTQSADVATQGART